MLVGLDEEICPHCRAPRDDMEMEEGRELIRKEELRLKRRPKRIAAAAAGLLVLCLAWFMRAGIAESLATSWRDFAAEVERTRDPRRYAAAQPPAADTPPVGATRPPDPTVVSSFVYIGRGASPAFANTEPERAGSGELSETFSVIPAAPAPVAVAAAAPAPIPPDGPFRRFYGVIFDLDTLQPLGGVKILFKGKGHEHGLTTTTNSRGHYQIDFFKGTDGELSVSAEIPGYRPGLLEDKEPSLLERGAKARQAVIAELVEGDLDPIPLRFRESAGLVELNLAVVPKAAK